MRRFLCVAGFALLSFKLSAQIQEVKFSQFMNFPLNVHPAQTGDVTGKYRVAGIYRRQWNSINAEFITYGLSGDVKIDKGFRESDYLGVGLYIIDDHLASNIMTHQKVGLNIAYHLPLDFQGRHVLSLGGSGSYSISSINIDELLFESQFQGFVPDASAPNGEPFVSDQQNNFGANAGISYHAKIQPRLSASVSASILNLIAPQQSFFNDSLAHVGSNSHVVSGHIKYKVNDKVNIVPRWFLYNDQRATELSTGVVAEYLAIPDKDLQIDLGLFGQWSEYASIYAGGSIKDLAVHVSYDFSISGLKSLADADNTGSQRPGVFELSLIYNGRSRKSTESYRVPCRVF